MDGVQEAHVRCIAHRGFAGVDAENTLPAVRSAADAGADAVEIDVRRCGSGELVVVHDADLGRLTGHTGAVAETPLSHLQELTVLDSDAAIPTLTAAFDALPDDVAVNVELKTTGLAEDSLAVADAHDNEVLFSSFERAALDELAALGVDALAYLFADGCDGLATARALDCRAVHPHREQCDAEFVDAAHDAGFDVNAWTVRSGAVADRLAAVGVDGLIVDDPRFCRP